MIRQAVEVDMKEILRMGEKFASLAVPEVPFDSESAETLVDSLMMDGNALLVAEKNGGLCGMLALCTFNHFFNNHHRMAQELFWWVDEEYRGTGIAKELMIEAEKWAKSKGCSMIQVASLSRLDGEKVGEMYKKHGYQSSENFYMRVL